MGKVIPFDRNKKNKPKKIELWLKIFKVSIFISMFVFAMLATYSFIIKNNSDALEKPTERDKIKSEYGLQGDFKNIYMGIENFNLFESGGSLYLFVKSEGENEELYKIGEKVKRENIIP